GSHTMFFGVRLLFGGPPPPPTGQGGAAREHLSLAIQRAAGKWAPDYLLSRGGRFVEYVEGADDYQRSIELKKSRCYIVLGIQDPAEHAGWQPARLDLQAGDR